MPYYVLLQERRGESFAIGMFMAYFDALAMKEAQEKFGSVYTFKVVEVDCDKHWDTIESRAINQNKETN